jgi:hypothetical protein
MFFLIQKVIKKTRNWYVQQKQGSSLERMYGEVLYMRDHIVNRISIGSLSQNSSRNAME